jgi:hypothetical protein
VSRERALRGLVGAAREQAGCGLKHLGCSNYAGGGHQMAPTGACSVCRIRANCEHAQRMQLRSQMKKTGVALCLKPSTHGSVAKKLRGRLYG